MNRRLFLKALATVTGGAILPQTVSLSSLSSMYKQANAAINYTSVNLNAPSVMPQVINIFLYGGPSELAGNLSNIADIEQNSQSKYTGFFPGILTPQGQPSDPDNNPARLDGSVTPGGFWGSNLSGTGTDNGLGAGGDDMQFLVDQGHMSVYRTMMKRKNTSQSHRESILMSQKGSLDIDFAAGFGFKLAALISENRALYEGTTALADGTGAPISDVEKLVMPFVSVLDGDTRIFDKDSKVTVPLLFNGISANSDLDNPFSRPTSSDGRVADPTEDAMFEAMAQKTISQSTKDYSEVIEAFKLRQELADAMGTFDGAFDTGGAGLNLPLLTDTDDIAANGGNALVYPNTSIGRSLRAAVTLAVENPGTLFTTVGGAFGGWDDHNNGVDRYPRRMREVFEALRVAMMHIKYTNNAATPINGLSRPTDNIIINVFGDFGRRVNLNTSLGWNHGNNQNFYTLGGARPGLRTDTGGFGPQGGLGKIVGKTVRTGNAGEDRQFTEPATNSYEFEPMSVAANIYKYFGVDYASNPISASNPDPLTSYEDPNNAGQFLDLGSPPIDEDPATNGAV